MKKTFSSALLLFLHLSLLQAQIAGELTQKILSEQSTFGGRIGVAAKNIATGETILVNADSLFPTASVIKLPILIELFYQFHEGKLFPEQPIALVDSVKKPGSGILQFLSSGQTLKLIDIATLMIIVSDNTGTNYIIDQLGREHEEKLEAVNGRMRMLGLKNTKLLNKLYSWQTKKKTEEARRFGIGVSTPADMVTLLEKIVRKEIVDSTSSEKIISIVRAQQDIQMAARYLPFMEDSTLWIGNKTGSLDEVKNDVGIVSNSKGTYVYAIFCDDSKDLGEQVDNTATLAVARVSRMLYEYFTMKQ